MKRGKSREKVRSWKGKHHLPSDSGTETDQQRGRVITLKTPWGQYSKYSKTCQERPFMEVSKSGHL